MSKPKEWWIVSPELTKHPFGESYNAVHTVTDYESTDSVHVIEFSAYAEVLAKLEAAEREIKHLRTKVLNPFALAETDALAKERAINAVLVEALNKFDRPEGKEPRNYHEVISRSALTKAKEMRDGE